MALNGGQTPPLYHSSRPISVDNNQLRIITLFLLALCIGLYFYTGEQETYYEQSAKPVVNDMLMEIGQWEKQALLNNLSAAAKSTISDQQVEQLLERYRQYGQLQSFEPLAFSRLASVFSLIGDSKVNYQTNATFSQGKGHINITVVAEGGSYKVYNLSINPVL